MSETLSPAVRQQLIDYKNLQQNLLILQENKTRAQIELEQIKQALTALEELQENELVFKRIGVLLIQSNKDKIKNELTERKTLLEQYVARIDAQLKNIEKKMKKLEEEIRSSQTSAG